MIKKHILLTCILLFGIILIMAGFFTGCSKECRVKFESNGETISEIIISCGDEAELPMEPSRSGYRFEGWFYDQKFEYEYQGEKLEADTVFYAKWTPKSYSIIYNLNGGVFEEEPKNVYVVGMREELAQPKKENYTFKGWYKNAALTGEALLSIPEETYGELVLFAGWEPKKFEIEYVLPEGSITDSPTEYIYGKVTNLSAANREGYLFDGWYMDSEYSGSRINAVPADMAGKIILYAKWIKVYEIKYELNGGINSKFNPENQIQGEEITLQEAQRRGYVFDGWFTDPNLKEQIKVIESSNEKPVTLYASWSIITYSITYLNTDNTELNPSSYTVETPITYLKNPIKDRYCFISWKYESDVGEQIKTIAGGAIGDLVLYADFEQGTPNVEYRDMGGDTGLYVYPNTFKEQQGKRLVIPDTYNNIPVTGIGDWTFNDYAGLEEIVIGPNSAIKYIGDGAFTRCINLKGTIALPDGLEYIGIFAFLSASQVDFSYSENLNLYFMASQAVDGTKWYSENVVNSKEDYVYFGKVLLLYRGKNSVVNQIREDTLGVAGSAFQYLSHLTQIVLPEGLVGLGDAVFRQCTGIKEITIPKSVKVVNYGLFTNWTNAQTVYLPFTEAEIKEMIDWNSWLPKKWHSGWNQSSLANIVYAEK